MSFICQLLLHCWSHFWTPEDLLHPGSRQMFVILFCLKKKKKLKIEQSYKHWKFHIGEISGHCLALTHSPGLFLHKMGFEIMFDDYLIRKKACLDYKNIDFRGLPHWIFSWFWSKIRTFLFVMRYQFGGVVQIKINLILWNPYTVGLLELYITSHATCPLRM